MRSEFALVDGSRCKAKPGLKGICPGCGGSVLSKCGEIRIWHWAHNSDGSCDHWWENVSEWHLNWQNQFPEDWRERWQTGSNGERHRADIETDEGWIFEFQRSPLDPKERRSRDAFYKNLIWVVDGTKRKGDWGKFEKIGEGTSPIKRRMQIDKLRINDRISITGLEVWAYPIGMQNRLLKEWSSCCGQVFIDFGREKLYWLVAPKESEVCWYIVLCSRETLMKFHLEGQKRKFEKIISRLPKLLLEYDLSNPGDIRNENMARISRVAHSIGVKF